MFERFNPASRATVALAQMSARMHQHAHIGTEHLLEALCDQVPSQVITGLDETGLTHGTVYVATCELIGDGLTPVSGHLPLTPAARAILQQSTTTAAQKGLDVSPVHILITLLGSPGTVATSILSHLKITAEQILEAVTSKEYQHV